MKVHFPAAEYLKTGRAMHTCSTDKSKALRPAVWKAGASGSPRKHTPACLIAMRQPAVPRLSGGLFYQGLSRRLHRISVISGLELSFEVEQNDAERQRLTPVAGVPQLAGDLPNLFQNSLSIGAAGKRIAFTHLVKSRSDKAETGGFRRVIQPVDPALQIIELAAQDVATHLVPPDPARSARSKAPPSVSVGRGRLRRGSTPLRTAHSYHEGSDL